MILTEQQAEQSQQTRPTKGPAADTDTVAKSNRRADNIQHRSHWQAGQSRLPAQVAHCDWVAELAAQHRSWADINNGIVNTQATRSLFT